MSAMTPDMIGSQLQRLLLQQEIDQLNADYAAALDEKRFACYRNLFVEYYLGKREELMQFLKKR